MRFFVFALLMSLAFTSPAQEKKTEKKAAAKKKPAPKASSQDWGRFDAGAKKSLDAKKDARKDAAKKK